MKFLVLGSGLKFDGLFRTENSFPVSTILVTVLRCSNRPYRYDKQRDIFNLVKKLYKGLFCNFEPNIN